MDYKTKAVSRSQLRHLSIKLRKLFGVPPGGPFPVLEALEMVPEVFRNCNYEVQEDCNFPRRVMARCIFNEEGGFTIQIRESVYVGAYEKHIGAYMGFICHEICHIFLFTVGFEPVFTRSFRDNELPAYESVEWQAKALCGEVMMPFDETEGKSVSQIMSEYNVSKGFAKTRQTYH